MNKKKRLPNWEAVFLLWNSIKLEFNFGTDTGCVISVNFD